MTSEITLYEAQKKKMQGLCDEHGFVYAFAKDQYPILFTITPVAGVGAQQMMLEGLDDDKTYCSPEAYMTWIFEDGVLSTKVSGGTFIISTTLRKKIESILMKMISFWQQYFFRDLMEHHHLSAAQMPVINEAEAEEPPSEKVIPEKGEDTPEEATDETEIDADLIQRATTLVRFENKATVSLLQRRLGLGYAASSRLMDKLEELGIVGQYKGGEPREVLPFDAPTDVQEG